jgi:hypothetical protein
LFRYGTPNRPFWAFGKPKKAGKKFRNKIYKIAAKNVQFSFWTVKYSCKGVEEIKDKSCVNYYVIN